MQNMGCLPRSAWSRKWASRLAKHAGFISSLQANSWSQIWGMWPSRLAFSGRKAKPMPTAVCVSEACMGTAPSLRQCGVPRRGWVVMGEVVPEMHGRREPAASCALGTARGQG